MANKEDNCTGHFWESRFKSQALLDERALLTCMAYVDLNPIRAGMAKSLADSEYTSVKERIEVEITDLLSFGKGDNDLPYYLSSYIDLVDETGRVLRDDKSGYMVIPPFLTDSKSRIHAAIKGGRPPFALCGLS